jgi:hypothetical protein
VHDPDYRQSWKDWESFVEVLTEKISEIDETIPELPPKDLVCSSFDAIFCWLTVRRSSESTGTFASAKTQRRTRYVSISGTNKVDSITDDTQTHFSAAW